MRKLDPDHRPLCRTVSFRLDDETYKRSQDVAHRAGVSPGQLIRALLDGEVLPEQKAVADKETSLKILAGVTKAERQLENLAQALSEAQKCGVIEDSSFPAQLGMLAAINWALREAVRNAH